MFDFSDSKNARKTIPLLTKGSGNKGALSQEQGAEEMSELILNEKIEKIDRIRLMDFALDRISRNEEQVARICLENAGLRDEKIESLLGLNLVGVEKEKEKLEKELEKISK